MQELIYACKFGGGQGQLVENAGGGGQGSSNERTNERTRETHSSSFWRGAKIFTVFMTAFSGKRSAWECSDSTVEREETAEGGRGADAGERVIGDQRRMEFDGMGGGVCGWVGGEWLCRGFICLVEARSRLVLGGGGWEVGFVGRRG